MYTGRAIKSNFEWIIVRIRTARNYNPFGNSSIIFKSICWSSRVLLSSGIAIVQLVHPISPTRKLESISNIHNDYHNNYNNDNLNVIHINIPSELDYINEVLLKSDILFECNLLKESKIILDNISDDFQNLSEIKWRQARLLYSLAKFTKCKNEKNSLIKKSYDYIKTALDMCNENFEIHKWMAIILDAKVELDGFKERIMQIYKIRQHMEYAVKLNPNDPSSWYFLGAYEFGLADLPWLHKKLLKFTIKASTNSLNTPNIDSLTELSPSESNFSKLSSSTLPSLSSPTSLSPISSSTSSSSTSLSLTPTLSNNEIIQNSIKQEQSSELKIPKGSYKKAFEHFQCAENLKPGFYSKNLLMLGKCSLALQKLQDAKKFLKKVTNFQVINREDQYCQKEAVELLKKIGTIKLE